MRVRHSATQILVIATLACRSGARPTPSPTTQPLSADERKAVAIAEAFVRDSCYTALPCDNTKIKPEFMEGHLKPEVIHKMRHNALKPLAYGVSPGTREGVADGWTVYFEFTDEWLRSLPMPPHERLLDPGLRGLYVSRAHQVLFMEHMDLRRDAPDKLTHGPTSTP